jgi:hypothetical protein
VRAPLGESGQALRDVFELGQADVAREQVNDDLELSAERTHKTLERADLDVVLGFEAGVGRLLDAPARRQAAPRPSQPFGGPAASSSRPPRLACGFLWPAAVGCGILFI